MLLTRLPLGIATPFDLHVLGTPPALVLSQDQTLHKNFMELSKWLLNLKLYNLSTKKAGDPQTYALAALFSFQGALIAREPATTPPTAPAGLSLGARRLSYRRHMGLSRKA